MFRVSLGFYSFLGFCWFFRFVFVLFLNLLSLPSPENSSWEKRIEQLLVSLEKKKGKGREGKVERECGGWGRKGKGKTKPEPRNPRVRAGIQWEGVVLFLWFLTEGKGGIRPRRSHPGRSRGAPQAPRNSGIKIKEEKKKPK